jgi:hypothetical protein
MRAVVAGAQVEVGGLALDLRAAAHRETGAAFLIGAPVPSIVQARDPEAAVSAIQEEAVAIKVGDRAPPELREADIAANLELLTDQQNVRKYRVSDKRVKPIANSHIRTHKLSGRQVELTVKQGAKTLKLHGRQVELIAKQIARTHEVHGKPIGGRPKMTGKTTSIMHGKIGRTSLMICTTIMDIGVITDGGMATIMEAGSYGGSQSVLQLHLSQPIPIPSFTLGPPIIIQQASTIKMQQKVM